MRIELSALFGLNYAHDVVEDAHIGDNVYLQCIHRNDWISRIRQEFKDENKFQRIVFREQLEWHVYTHRLYVSVDEVSDVNDLRIFNARQDIMRAIVLSRIIKPTPIPLHPTLIKAVYPDSEEPYHSVEINVGFHGTAYNRTQLTDLTITKMDAENMAKHWRASQYIHNNRTHYRRIYRALMVFNDSFHIWPSNLSHVALHAALESLICTSYKNNKNQVVKRLPQLLPQDITEFQATAIYHFCADVKHTAAPSLLSSKDTTDMDAQDKERYESAKWLEDSVRKLFLKALEDRSFADTLEDAQLLASKYPVS